MTPPKIKYYSQFGEDQALFHVFNNKPDNHFVDVGSHDGVTDSNTLMLEQRGWRGICIEPHSQYFKKLVKNRPKAVRLKIAVWSENLPIVEFHETAPGGWSRIGGGGKFPTVRRTYPRAYTLDVVLNKFRIPKEFGLLSIDVEGHTPQVLKGYTLEKHKPRIVIIEDLSKKGQHDDYFHEYKPVYAWKQRKKGSNIFYCLYDEDYEIVKEKWR